jgi:hypothetical protein
MFKLEIKWIVESYIFWDITSCSSDCYLLHVDFFLGVFFDPAGKRGMFFRNDGQIVMGYAALYPRR